LQDEPEGGQTPHPIFFNQFIQFLSKTQLAPDSLISAPKLVLTADNLIIPKLMPNQLKRWWSGDAQ